MFLLQLRKSVAKMKTFVPNNLASWSASLVFFFFSIQLFSSRIYWNNTIDNLKPVKKRNNFEDFSKIKILKVYSIILKWYSGVKNRGCDDYHRIDLRRRTSQVSWTNYGSYILHEFWYRGIPHTSQKILATDLKANQSIIR